MFRRSQSAFTIVELLIVIVVIAILASVTVVAYNGVQQRAVNAQLAAAMNANEKALKLYVENEGQPLQADSSWYHSSIINMAGLCIAGEWPSNTALADELSYPGAQDWYHGVANSTWQVTGADIRDVYCGQGGGNGSISRGEALEYIDNAIQASSLASSFAAVPMANPITVDAIAQGGAVSSYAMRGVRYSYNNNPADLTSYLFYPIHGKECLVGDATVRLQDTVWASAGSSVWTGTFETGGDYTANNTAYCVREVKY